MGRAFLTLATLAVAIATPLAATAAGQQGDDGAPPGHAVPAQASGRDGLSFMPAFLRNLFGGSATAADDPAAVRHEAGDSARPERRVPLVTLVEPLWIDLTAAQQQALAPFAPEWNTWPAAEKKSWVALANGLERMSGERRAKAERRIFEWANLTPAQRRLARENYRLAKERPAGERVTEWHNYQSLTREQQDVLRRAGSTSNTAAGHAGASTGLAKEASQPLPRIQSPTGTYGIVPARGTPR